VGEEQSRPIVESEQNDLDRENQASELEAT
jgi:hypothetical protein